MEVFESVGVLRSQPMCRVGVGWKLEVLVAVLRGVLFGVCGVVFVLVVLLVLVDALDRVFFGIFSFVGVVVGDLSAAVFVRGVSRGCVVVAVAIVRAARLGGLSMEYVFAGGRVSCQRDVHGRCGQRRRCYTALPLGRRSWRCG